MRLFHYSIKLERKKVMNVAQGRIQNEDTTLFLKILFPSLPEGKVRNIIQGSQMAGHISNWILYVSFPVFLPYFPSIILPSCTMAKF
jgi:hypothetical protein